MRPARDDDCRSSIEGTNGFGDDESPVWVPTTPTTIARTIVMTRPQSQVASPCLKPLKRAMRDAV